MNSGLTTILTFGIFAMITIFTGVLIFEIGEDYIINNVATAGKDAINSTTDNYIAAQQNDRINELQTEYSAYSFPFDIFFLISLLGAFVLSVISVFKSSKEGVFSFFGYIFIGSLILLLITSYLYSFTNWFQTEIFNALFSDTTISTPIFNWFISNMGVINFVWWLILVLIAAIDRSFISKSGEVIE